MALTPIRRVVTGNDANGKSKVVWDGPSPGTHETNFNARGHTDFWVWRETPAPLNGKEDAGTWDDEFPNPVGGGHQRVVHWLAKTPESPPNDPYLLPSLMVATGQAPDPRQLADLKRMQAVAWGTKMEGELVRDTIFLLAPGGVKEPVLALHALGLQTADTFLSYVLKLPENIEVYQRNL